MTSRFLFILFSLFLLSACTSNTIMEKPDDLIPKNQMIDLLTDIHLAYGAENVKNISLKRNVNYFPLVYEKYKIDSTRFKRSNFYYTSRIDDYDEMLGEVQKRLEVLKSKYDTEKRIQDSIQKATKGTSRKLPNNDSIMIENNSIRRRGRILEKPAKTSTN